MSVSRLRPARRTDAPQIELILGEAWPQPGERFFRGPARCIDSYSVLEAAGLTVAFMQFENWRGWSQVGGMEDHNPAFDDTFSVSRVAVLEAWRGQGIGSHLLEEWLAQLPEHIEYVVLDPVPANGPAAEDALRRFYARQGFQLLPPSREHFGRPAHLMGWSRDGVFVPELRA